MPALEQAKDKPDRSLSVDTLKELIRRQVVQKMGTLPELLGIHVRPLWNDRYRVNVVVGKEVSSSRITRSYFVVADEHGTIVKALPEINTLEPPKVKRSVI